MASFEVDGPLVSSAVGETDDEVEIVSWTLQAFSLDLFAWMMVHYRLQHEYHSSNNFSITLHAIKTFNICIGIDVYRRFLGP